MKARCNRTHACRITHRRRRRSADSLVLTLGAFSLFSPSAPQRPAKCVRVPSSPHARTYIYIVYRRRLQKLPQQLTAALCKVAANRFSRAGRRAVVAD